MGSKSLEHRFATEEDLPQLATWNHELIADEGHRNPMNEEELRQRMASWLASRYHALVYSLDEEDVGYLLYREDDDKTYLRQFFVTRHNRRKGLGRKMASHFIDEVRATDKRLTVETLSCNQAALAFWRSTGFKDYCVELEMPPRR